MTNGLFFAFIGAALAVTLAGIGSAKGIALVGEASMGLIAEEPSKFARLLIMQLLPGTQGLYGFIISILIMTNIGVLGGEIPGFYAGLMYLAASLPIGLVGYFSAVAQAKASAAGINVVAKRPIETVKAIVSVTLSEMYALIAFIVSLLLVLEAENLAQALISGGGY